jgi:hypothetical protein
MAKAVKVVVEKCKGAKEVVAEVVKVVKVDQEKGGYAARGSIRYKARFVYSDKNFSIDVPVRWQKFASRDVDKEYPVIYRNAKGEETRNKMWVDGKIIKTDADDKEGWFNPNLSNVVTQNRYPTTANGELINKDEVKAYQVVDGKETYVEKYKKTDEFNVLALKDMDEYEDWMLESGQGMYKVWAEEEDAIYSLYQFTKKYLVEKNKFAVVYVTSGNSYNKYYGLIRPVIKDVNGKQCFALTMKVAKQKIDWENSEFVMPIIESKPSPKAKATEARTGLAEL